MGSNVGLEVGFDDFVGFTVGEAVGRRVGFVVGDGVCALF